MVSVSVTINSVAYTGILKLKVKQAISNYTKFFELELTDPSGSKYSSISYGDDVQIQINGTTVFRGLIESRELTRDKRLRLAGRDYFLRFTERFVTKTYLSKTASEIITDLINSYFSSEFTTTQVQSTTTTYDRTYKGAMVADILREMAALEDYVIFVDESKDVVFRPSSDYDSGKHYSNEILEHKFPEVGSKVRNSVLVIYGTNLDQGVRRQNEDSIAQYGLKEHRIISSSIQSEDEAIQRAEFELSKYANPLVLGEVVIKMDETIEAGQIIWLTISQLGYSDEQFLVLEAEHSVTPPYSKLKVAQISRETSEVLESMLSKLRKVDEERVSSEAVIATYTVLDEEITVTVKCTVERRTITGANYAEFKYSKKRYGQQSGSWTKLVDEQVAALTNTGIELLARLIAQLALVKTKLDASNSFIAVGSSSTVAKITDTSLGSESDRNGVDPGSPRVPSVSPSDGKVLWEATFNDSDFVNATLREFGLFNAGSGGDLFSRYVHSSNLSKAQDEEVKVTFLVEFSGDLTTAGLNLLRDLLAGFSTDYLDATNAAIEVTGSTTYRELVNTGFPKNSTTLYDVLEYQIRVTNPGEIATGATIIQVDLYNKSSGGVQVASKTIATITTVAGEDNVFRVKLKLKR